MEQALTEAWEAEAEKLRKGRKDRWDKTIVEPIEPLLLAMTYAGHIYYHRESTHFEGHEHYITRLTINWRRVHGRVVLQDHSLDRVDFKPTPWRSAFDENKEPLVAQYAWAKERIYLLDDENIELEEAALAEHNARVKQAAERRRVIDSIAFRVGKAFAAAEQELAKQKFLAEYGDPDLWEGHLKSLKLHGHAGQDLWGLIDALVSRNIDPVGKTLGECIALVEDKTFRLHERALALTVPAAETTSAVVQEEDNEDEEEE